MRLSQVIAAVPDARLVGADVDVSAVVEDSRQAGPGRVFCAIAGLHVDGHQFIAAAVAAGAAAVVSNRELDLAVPQVIVADTARALGVMSAALAGDPGARLSLIGITGTNGKTTNTYLIEAMLAAAGHRAGVIGTVSYRYGAVVEEAPYTTPTPGILHGLLGELVAARCTHGVLETSSAALAMGRLAGLRFAVGVFTNLTQDHLDLHGDMDAYRAAKARLFADHLAPDGVAVINVDADGAAAMIAAAGSHRVVRVSLRPAAEAEAEVRVTRYRSSVAGIEADLDTPHGPLHVSSAALLGEYNVANIATAVAVGEALGLPHEAVARGIAAMPGVPGRVERVPNDRGLTVVVDYAHTPDALANVLAALRPITERRLICVFGCGGDRDPSKRPKMGAEVARGADLAVVTSDNPRTEDPQAILDMIVPAVPDPFVVDVSRRAAIAAAVCEATPGDVVVIAGKGHEDYQILGTDKIHFDDREEAAAAMAARPRWTAAQVAGETGGELLRGAPETTFERIVIDGRSAAPGDLYVAIVGERFDGHDFVAQALAAGARGALVRRGAAAALGELPAGACVIEVDDPRAGLGRLAHHHRRRWGRTVVGITGSSGKTTVKDLAAAALAPVGRVLKPAGSLNNETGVPLTLLSLRSFHDVAVIEMGMRGLGHIDYLADMAGPDVAVVVNAQKAHVGVVGSEDDIARGKSEIYRHLPAGGVAIAPAGDDRLTEAARASRGRVVTFGAELGADVRAAAYQSRPDGHSTVTIEHGGDSATAEIPFAGAHNASNAACAVAVATAAGVPLAEAVAALSAAVPSAMRGQVAELLGRRVMIDCYNANPASMSAALATLAELSAGHAAVAVLGDMLELGDSAAEEHAAIGRRARELGIGVVVLGEHAGDVVRGYGAGAGSERVADPGAAAARAEARTQPGDWILVKASRGMRLERVVEALRARGGHD